MKKIIYSIVVLIITAFLFIKCSSSSDSDATDNFDRNELLKNWADNIIIPSNENYQSSVQDLAQKVTAFTSSPTSNTLQEVRFSWLTAYKSYQKTSMFVIGKAAEINLNESANTYPTDAAGIENNIAYGTYNLNLFAQFPKQGFPAIDYLINGLGTTDNEIISFYTTNSNALNYKNYLIAITTKLKSNIDAVVTDWNSNYRATYIASSGTGVSSSISKTTNLFVKNLEKPIRTGKVGIPAGLFSNGTLYPEKVEAYYKNDVSRELLSIALQAEQDFFNGKYANSAETGASLKSYLIYLNAIRNGQNLSDIINNQFATIKTTVAQLNGSFSTQVNSDNAKMIAAYNEMQQAVIYCKLDMMQALNITIDYVDGDGD